MPLFDPLKRMRLCVQLFFSEFISEIFLCAVLKKKVLAFFGLILFFPQIDHGFIGWKVCV